MRIDRRRTLALLGAAAASLAAPHVARTAAGRVVIVGGGMGGATASRRLLAHDPAIRVTLVEPGATYTSCTMGNAALAGLMPFDRLVRGYDRLRAMGVEVVRDRADHVDADAREVLLAGGGRLPWDALILSPGIAVRWDALPGYDEAAANSAPHAWLRGEEAVDLGRRLEAMPDGGLFVIVAPDNPYRCPTAPYERASLVAEHFRTARPAAKILILDAKDGFPTDLRFRSAWPELYGDMVEWVPRSNDGRVVRVDAGLLEVETEFGERIRADVLNVIPPQKAAAIAESAGVTDATGWAPVRHETFESVLVPGIHVIGDAALAVPMPKAASSAAAQAGIAAAAIASRLAGREPPPFGSIASAVYALAGSGYGVSSVGLFRVVDGYLADIGTESGISPPHGGPAFRAREAGYAVAAFEAAMADAFGPATS